jgi:hypothetical protein
VSTGPRNRDRDRDKDRDKDRDRELAEILQEAQLVRPDTLQRAQREARQAGESLWGRLLREGILSDEQLFRILKQYTRVPVLAEEHLENILVPPELQAAITPKLAQRLGVLPLERSTDGQRAVLAMIDPTLDIAPLWPALTQLGVSEVRRFLLSLPTLRRGMQMFYGQIWQPDASDAALDGPTPPPSRSAITMPIPQPVDEGPSVLVDPQLQAEIAQLGGSGPVPAPVSSAEPTVPLATPAPAPAAASPGRPGTPLDLLTTMPSTRSSPRSEASASSLRPTGTGTAAPAASASSLPPASPIPVEGDHADRSAGGTAVPAAARSAPLPSRVSQPPPPSRLNQRLPPLPTPVPGSRGQVGGALPSIQSGPVRPPPPKSPPPGDHGAAGRASAPKSTQSPLPELSAADVVVDEDRSGLTLDPGALRVPTAPAPAAREVAPDAVQDALIATCEALVATFERQHRSSWPTALSRLCQGVGDRLGFAPRAVRELMLVARLWGVLRLELLSRGPLPPRRPGLLDLQTDAPLMAALRELQKALVDFMRLPRDEEEPLGARIVATAEQALELHRQGVSEQDLPTKLRAQAGDTDVVFHVQKALGTDPPQLDPLPVATPPGPPAPANDRWPLPPRMPAGPWRTVAIPLSELSAEGLTPYHPG